MAKSRTVVLLGAALAGVEYLRRQRQGGAAAAPDPAPAAAAAPVGARAAEPEAAAAPAIANADAAGPPENTATHVPAPGRETAAHQGQVAGVLDDTGGLDEEAEEAAAAAEAANIGGPAPEYPSAEEFGELADPADRAVEEGGGGESEGEELAEYDLQANAEDDFDSKSDAEKQLDEVIADQDDPSSGEVREPE